MHKNSKKIILIGAGGHCKVVIDAIKRSKHYVIEGIVDRDINLGKKVLDICVIGNDENLKDFYRNGIKNAFISIGSIGDCSLRLSIFKKIKRIGFNLPIIIDPSAVVSKHSYFDEGVFIAAGSVVNAGVWVGKNAIINTSSSIDHDCKIGDFTHIAPGVTVSGGVTIGRFAHIGTGAIVNQGIKIGQNCLIGSGSVVVKNLKENSKAFGNPCRITEKRISVVNLKEVEKEK